MYGAGSTAVAAHTHTQKVVVASLPGTLLKFGDITVSKNVSV